MQTPSPEKLPVDVDLGQLAYSSEGRSGFQLVWNKDEQRWQEMPLPPDTLLAGAVGALVRWLQTWQRLHWALLLALAAMCLACAALLQIEGGASPVADNTVPAATPGQASTQDPE